MHSNMATRDFTNLNKSCTVGKPLNGTDSCASNNLMLYVGMHREAMENNMKSPKLGILIDSSNDTPSSNSTYNLFNSTKLSDDARCAFNNFSINEHATRRGLLNLFSRVDHANL